MGMSELVSAGLLSEQQLLTTDRSCNTCSLSRGRLQLTSLPARSPSVFPSGSCSASWYVRHKMLAGHRQRCGRPPEIHIAISYLFAYRACRATEMEIGVNYPPVVAASTVQTERRTGADMNTRGSCGNFNGCVERGTSDCILMPSYINVAKGLRRHRRRRRSRRY
jgi:hypothetical protein